MRTVRGIIGGLVGGFIASIPWILASVYINMMVGYFAIPIAMGVKFGYQLFGGEKDKKLPFIIAGLSIVIIVVVTLVVIPLVLLGKEGYPMDFTFLKLLYNNSKFVTSQMIDLVVAVIFTGLGISGVVKAANEDVSINNRKDIVMDVNIEDESTIEEIENKEEESEQ